MASFDSDDTPPPPPSDDDELPPMPDDDDAPVSYAPLPSLNIEEQRNRFVSKSQPDLLFTDNVPNIVMDMGNGNTRLGFAGEEKPKFQFPTMVGYPLSQFSLRKKRDYKNLSYSVGNDISVDRELTICNPWERGLVHNWDELEVILEHSFHHLLRADTSQAILLWIESPFTPKKVRERLGEILFEKFNFYGLAFHNHAVMSLYSMGRTTGLVLDSGDQVSYTVPVFEGYMLPHCINKINIGGKDVTEYLQRILTEKGYYFMYSSMEFLISKQIKEKLSKVSLQYKKDLRKPETEFEAEFLLPDGQKLTVGKERFRAPEVMFQPSIIGMESEGGVIDILLRSFKGCDIDVRKHLYGNVVLTGGNTLLDGFQERVTQELNDSETNFKTFTVHADAARQTSAWLGGSVIGSLAHMDDSCVTFDEFQDYGSNVLHRHVTTYFNN